MFVTVGSRIVLDPITSEGRKLVGCAEGRVWEVTQVDVAHEEALLEPMNTESRLRLKRIGAAMWVKARDPRFIFWRIL